MPIRLGINGAGRIGRMVMRLALNDPEVEVVAVNHPNLDPKSFVYLFKYDSVHGRFQGDIEHNEQGDIFLQGQKLAVFTHTRPELVPWNEANVDIVLECSGKFKASHASSAGGHHSFPFNNNVKCVIVSCPGDNIPTFVMGVNHNEYTPSMKVISNASCTTNCLAPIAKVLHQNFGIETGLMTSIHAATASQALVDGTSKKDFRLGRSVFNNIIPATTGAAKAVGLVIPELQGKLTGTAMRVPTADVSVVDLTVNLKTPTTYEQIKKAMKEASETYLKGTLSYTDDDVVSTDFISVPYASIFDAKAGLSLTDTFAKVVAWYDNETGYSQSLILLAKYVFSVSETDSSAQVQ